MTRMSGSEVPISVVKAERSAGESMHVQWDGGRVFPLLRLRRDTEILPLTAERRFPTYDELQKDQRVLVFCERSGGGRSFLRWWQQQLTIKKRPWLYTQGRGWEADLFDLSKQALAETYTTGEGDVRQTPVAYMTAFGQAKDAASKAAVLIEWAEARRGKKPFFLIFRDLSALGEAADATAGALRLFGDQRDPSVRNSFHVVIVSSSEATFEDRMDVSGFGAMCQQYRLPFLNRDEIQHLAAAMLGDRLPEGGDSDLLARQLGIEIEEAVGGQVKLVQDLLQRLLSEGNAASSLHTLLSKYGHEPDRFEDRLRQQVRKAVAALRDSPPTAVEFWMRDLQARLHRNQPLIEILRTRVEGVRIPAGTEPPGQEAALLIPGWVRFDHLDCWGIASPFHAHFARKVLDKLGTSVYSHEQSTR